MRRLTSPRWFLSWPTRMSEPWPTFRPWATPTEAHAEGDPPGKVLEQIHHQGLRRDEDAATARPRASGGAVGRISNDNGTPQCSTSRSASRRTTGRRNASAEVDNGLRGKSKALSRPSS